MPKPFAKIRIHRNPHRARQRARFGLTAPSRFPGGYRLVAVEEVEPVLANVTEDARFGSVVLFYEQDRTGARLSITQGYTSPAQVAGAPAGSWGRLTIGDKGATWIAGHWEVSEPSPTAPAHNPEAFWVDGGIRLTWRNGDLTSTTLEADSLSLDELLAIAGALVEAEAVKPGSLIG